MRQDYTGEQFGDYKLLRLLGEGGFAEVYLAEHKHNKAPAAVKLPKEQQFEGFVNELRRTVLLQHDHIVRIRDFGIRPADKKAFIIMDYAPHGSLRQQHPSGTQVPLDKVVSYVKQAASALQYAHDHEQRVIHRDVKPHNFLLKTPDFVLLSDFGIATAPRTTTAPDSTQGIAGTYAYMSPEQLIGRPCFASDQYSLAIMVYEWLCGELPFSGQEYVQWLYQHQRMPPPSLQERVPSLSPDVEAVVFKALAKKPEDRFARVEDFANYLEQAATGKAHVTSVRPTNRPNPSLAGKQTGIPSQTPPHPIEQLIREGVQAQTHGEPEKAYDLYQKVTNTPGVPSHYVKVAQNGIRELRPQVVPLIRKRADEAALLGHWHDEIGAWEELLTLNPSEREIGSPLTLGRQQGDIKQRIQERIRVARQNEQWTWMYANAEQFIREQDKASALALLRMLWRNAPRYGDPADLAKEVGLPPAKNYGQALAEELARKQALEQALAEQQAREQALAEQQARLKRSIISISLTIVSIVLSTLSLIIGIAATHISPILLSVAAVVGVGAGAGINATLLRKLVTREAVVAAAAGIAIAIAGVGAVAAGAGALELAVVGVAVAVAGVAIVGAAAGVAAELAVGAAAGVGLLAAAIVVVGAAAVVIMKNSK